MTCSTCQNCIITSHDITSPGGFNLIAVEFEHCMIHDLPVEPTDYCEDYNGRLEA